MRWLVLALVLVMSFEVAMRYLFNAPTMWAYETSMMLGGSVYVFAWTYVHQMRAHIRVDVFYAHLSDRKRLAVDIVGTLFLFFPLLFFLSKSAIVFAVRAWVIKERMMDTAWFPPAAPFRTIVAAGYVLLLIQGKANFIRDVYSLIRNKAYD